MAAEFLFIQLREVGGFLLLGCVFSLQGEKGYCPLKPKVGDIGNVVDLLLHQRRFQLVQKVEE